MSKCRQGVTLRNAIAWDASNNERLRRALDRKKDSGRLAALLAKEEERMELSLLELNRHMDHCTDCPKRND